MASKHPQRSKKTGVLGYPVAQSLSPQIFAEMSLSSNYKKFSTPPHLLRSSLVKLQSDPSVVGFNVTVPYKEKLIHWVDVLSREARRVGAVNVIRFSKKRKPKGFNTDVVGINHSLNRLGFKPKNKTVLILGSGGAARSVAFVLAKRGVRRIFVMNRTPQKAFVFCESFKKKFPKTQFDYWYHPHEKWDLVVQCTPLGRKKAHRRVYPVPLNELFENAGRGAMAFDLVYAKTPFLKEAKAKGLRSLDGLPMLVAQALASAEIWFGPLANKRLLQGRIERKLRKIIVTG